MKEHPRHRWFITGTDTDVGKTIVSAAVANGLRQLGASVAYWKPVQTGRGTLPSDAETVAALRNDSMTILPTRWQYAPALAPDQAASLEGAAAPTVEELVAELRSLNASIPETTLLIEGAGGLLVPLNDDADTWLDFLIATGAAPIVVARTSLGTLNHTSLTCERLVAAGITPLAVVLNGETNEPNERSLRRMLPGVDLVHFPSIDGLAENRRWPSQCRELATRLRQLAEQRTARSGNWQEADRRYCWHPFTQHANDPEPMAVRAARDVWLYLENGTRVLDGIGSWWVNTLGHGRPEIAAALAGQHRRLDHVLFAGACHEPAAELAERLIRLTGNRFERVFYSDDGSTSVEVALKMARQFWVNRGEPQRTRVIAFRNSYHGDTFGAMSVGAESGFFQPFKPFLFEVEWAEHPRQGAAPTNGGFTAHADRFRGLLERHSDTAACVIVEPLLQGAGGMKIHSEKWLQYLAAQCHDAGIPLILDEVFTGFGRVGTGFAFERAGVVPDIVCLSKALTGGSVPLAATLATGELFESFRGDSKAQALLHGHSYTGNPISCRAALSALDIYEREGVAARGQVLEEEYRAWINGLPEGLVFQPRALGSVLAFELGSGDADYFAGGGRAFAELALERGLFVRPLGNTVYLTPPLTITQAQQKHALDALGGALQAWHRQARGA